MKVSGTRRGFPLDFLSVVELRTKLVSVSTLALASAYVIRRNGLPEMPPFVLMWAATLAVDMGTTAFNNYFDYLKGTDSWRDIDEPDKVLVHSGVSPGFALASAASCYAIAVVLGLAIAFSGYWWVIPSGAACMAVGFFYTGGPYPISRTPLGELFAGGCLGLALFLIALGVWGVDIGMNQLLAGIPSALAIAAILAVNNACDIEGDRDAGRKTMAIVLGHPGAEIYAVCLMVAGIIVAVPVSLAGILPKPCSLTLLAASVPIVLVLKAMHKRGYSHATKGPNMGGVLSCFLAFTVGTLGGYAAEAIPLIFPRFR